MPDALPPVLLEPQRSSTLNRGLVERVLTWLTEQLVNGELRSGQWVSENEVASRLGVSRSPVREALRDLAQEGLVEVHPRRATIVAELSAEDAADIYWARQLIYAEMARLAVEQITDDGVDELMAIVEDMRRSLGHPRAWFDCTRRWWQLLMDFCPSRSVRDMAAMLWRRSIRSQGILTRMAEQQQEYLKYAERFIEYARSRDAEGAGGATAAMLRATRQRLLENVFLQIDEDGSIARQLFRADGAT
jgi:DNA-binding GntR family transcriptional regulator